MSDFTLFTSESVTEGHFDKLADQISDAVLDELLKKDPRSRVALETFLTRGLCVVGGELTTDAYVEIADFATPAELLAALDHATVRGRRSNPLVHVQTVFDKRLKRRQGATAG